MRELVPYQPPDVLIQASDVVEEYCTQLIKTQYETVKPFQTGEVSVPISYLQAIIEGCNSAIKWATACPEEYEALRMHLFQGYKRPIIVFGAEIPTEGK
jgi:hypothetical protein